MGFKLIGGRSKEKKRAAASGTLKNVLERIKKTLVKKTAKVVAAQLGKKGKKVETTKIERIIQQEKQSLEVAAQRVAADPGAEGYAVQELAQKIGPRIERMPMGVPMVVPETIPGVDTPSVSEALRIKLAGGSEKTLSPEMKARLEEDQKRGREEKRVGAEISRAGEKNRYMVPYGYVAPLLKDMSGPRIIEKVQELYHVPFEVGDKEKATINIRYPLIPAKPKQGEPVNAWAHIYWHDAGKELIYYVLEPKLSPHEVKMLKKIEDKLEEKLDIVFVPDQMKKHTEYLRRKIRDIIDLYGFKINPQTSQKLEYYITRDFVGLGRIEPLMSDGEIEDISCDGFDIPLYIFHRNPKYGQIKTNIIFKGKDELDSFVVKLAQKSGKNISVARPLLDASLPDGSRLQTTLGSDIARRGSNFTIRKFTKDPITPTRLMEFGTANPTVLAFMWLCIEYGKSILIAGSTATGKTSMLNATSLFIRPELKVVSIEDTAELKLPHPNWVPQVARPGYGERSYGAVEMFDLLKAALRQRPDYVIVGEVRGAEASVMFQGMATGHPSLATIHASSLQSLVDRLTTPPISLSPALLENLDIIMFLEKSKIKGRFVRRIKEINENMGVNVKAQKVLPNKMFEWNPVTDEIAMTGKSIILKKIAEFRGIDYEMIMKELKRRALFLEWLGMNNVTGFVEFSQWIRSYYSDPEKVMEKVMKDVRRKAEQEADETSA
ncbi:MAG: type II/IV secretion system ATPase subunit [Candidatus Altiarchaeota archaeon]|nr:type II/IV secretion system ATPase subunit [Candidatus Altiarchaeota archaeon]